MERPLALVVCDQPGAREKLREILVRVGVEVLETESPTVALEFIRSRSVGILLADLERPGGATGDFLNQATRLRPTLVPLVLTPDADSDSVVELLRGGAFDVVAEPIDSHRAHVTIFKALAQNRFMEELARLRSQLRGRSGYQGLVGRSVVMERLRERLQRQTALDTPVFLLGEAGSGKELAARAVHAMSGRRGQPFVTMECSDRDAKSLDPELFGHEPGALPGNDHLGVGLLESAEGGCLFLDEITSLPFILQGRLLQVLQEGMLRRVGGTENLPLNVRIFSASSRDVEMALNEGRLREDLYQRLSANTIQLPPLRERREDVALLASHFIEAICEINDLPVFHFSPEALELLESYSWPGNVRELRNAMEQAVILAGDQTIRPRDLPQAVRHAERTISGVAPSGRPFKSAKKEVVEAFEQAYLSDLLERHRGNVTAAAHRAGMLRSALQRLLRKYDMRSADFRERRRENAPEQRP